jgi:hypothetical protein
MILTSENTSTWRKTCPIATLFTTSSICTGLNLNFNLTKCKSRGMAPKFILHISVCCTPSSGRATCISAQNHMFCTRLLSMVTCIIEYKIHTIFYNVIYNDRNNSLIIVYNCITISIIVLNIAKYCMHFTFYEASHHK